MIDDFIRRYVIHAIKFWLRDNISISTFGLVTFSIDNEVSTKYFVTVIVSDLRKNGNIEEKYEISVNCDCRDNVSTGMMDTFEIVDSHKIL